MRSNRAPVVQEAPVVRGTVSLAGTTRRLPTNLPLVRTTSAHPTVQASLLTISRTFDSLFKVLFIFPSRYLFAIGLSSLFSLRWGIPPALSCNPKQLDSSRGANRLPHALRDCHPPWCAIPCDLCALQPGVHFRILLQLQQYLAALYKFGLVPLHSPLLRES